MSERVSILAALLSVLRQIWNLFMAVLCIGFACVFFGDFAEKVSDGFNRWSDVMLAKASAHLEKTKRTI